MDPSECPCFHYILRLFTGKNSGPKDRMNHYDATKEAITSQPKASDLALFEESYTGDKQESALGVPSSVGEGKEFTQPTSQVDCETSQANTPSLETKLQRTDDKGEESEHLKERLNQLEMQFAEEQKKMEKQYQQMNKSCRRKDEQIKELSNRLASEMGTKVAADESSLENINIKDRPMNIASEYELLCSNEWLAAKDALDNEQKDMTEEMRLKLLCDILQIGLSEAADLKESIIHGIGAVLSKPGITAVDECKVPEGFTLSEKFMQNLMDLERQSVGGTDLTLLDERIHTQTSSKMEDSCTQDMLKSENMTQYIKSVAVLTWKMVLQRPPMRFRQDGVGHSWQGEKKQEVYWNSCDPSDPDSRVVLYVHPALYHGEAMMVKGKVFIRKKGFVEGIKT